MTDDERRLLAWAILLSIIWLAVLFNTGAPECPQPRASIETPEVMCIHSLQQRDTVRRYDCFSIYGDLFWYTSKRGDSA